MQDFPSPNSNLNVMNLCECSKEAQISLWKRMSEYYYDMYDMHSIFTWEEFYKHFIAEGSMLRSYVGVNYDGYIESMISYYEIGSNVLDNNLVPHIACAYLYHHFSENEMALSSLFINLVDIMKIAGVDVFNCLNIMNNSIIINSFGLKPGDGYLNYYLYNWKTSFIPLDKLAYAVF